MYAEERQQAIAELVAQRGRLSVSACAAEFDVTTETVRRDLSTLERIGLVRRVHGGAVPPSALTVIESGLGERDQANTDAEGRGSPRAALDLLPPGRRRPCSSTPASTTARLAGAAPPRPPPRPSSPTPCRSPPGSPAPPASSCTCCPGRVRPTTQAAVGDRHRRGARRSCAPTSPSSAPTASAVGHGLTTPDRDEAATKRAIVASARRVVVLADSTKIGRRAPRSASPTLDEVDVLVTDDGIADADRARPRAGRRRGRASHDRHPHRQPQPSTARSRCRRRSSAARCSAPTSVLSQAGGKGVNISRAVGRRRRSRRSPCCPRRKDDPFVLELLARRHRLPPGRPPAATCGSTSRSPSPTAPPPSSTAPAPPSTHRAARRARRGAASTAPPPPTGSCSPARCRRARRSTGTPSWSPRCATPAPGSPSTPATRRSARWSSGCPAAPPT